MSDSAEPSAGCAGVTQFQRNHGMYIQPEYLPPSAWLGHIPFAGWLVNASKPETIVELGTHHGASYMAFCQAVVEADLQSRCYAVDTWLGDEQAGFYSDDVINQLRDHHDAVYGTFSLLMRMTFDQALCEFDDGSVDLLHIDGLHTYEAVRGDFESWLPKMSERGIVLFHDIAEHQENFGVWRFWEEIRECFPTFEFMHSHGLGVALVGKFQVQPMTALALLAPSKKAEVRREFEALGRAAEAQGQVRLLRLQLEGIRQGLDEYRTHADALEEERLTLVAANQGMAAENAKSGQSLQAITATLESTRQELISLQHGFDEYRACASALEEQRDQLLDANQHLASTLESTRGALASATHGLGEYRAHASALEKHRDQLRNENQHLADELESTLGELALATHGLGEYGAHASALEKHRDQLLSENQHLAGALESTLGALASTTHGLDEYRAHAQALEQERDLHGDAIRRAEARLCEAEDRQRALEQTSAALHQQRDLLRADLTERSQRVEGLENDVDAMRRSRSWRMTAWLRRLSRIIRGGK